MKQLSLDELKLEAATAQNHLNNILKMLEEEEAKAKQKVVSIKDLPVGTVVTTSNCGTAFVFNENRFAVKMQADGKFNALDTGEWDKSKHKYRKLVEQKEFTFSMPTPDRKCPLPEGVIVEVVLRNYIKEINKATSFIWPSITGLGDIIAYRIIGLADGYVLGE